MNDGAIKGQVELTSKSTKLMVALSVVLMIIGMVLLAVGRSYVSTGPAYAARGSDTAAMVFTWIGGITTAAGVVWLIYAKTLQWWHHG